MLGSRKWGVHMISLKNTLEAIKAKISTHETSIDTLEDVDFLTENGYLWLTRPASLGSSNTYAIIEYTKTTD